MCVGMLDIIHIMQRTYTRYMLHIQVCRETKLQLCTFFLYSPCLLVSCSLCSLLPFLSPFITFTLLYSHPSSLSAYSAAPVYYSAAAVSQALLLLLAPAVATGPITSPSAEDSVLPPLLLLLLFPLFVIHCVVTLIIMDSAQVFRLSAGSWSPHITLSLTCTQTRTGIYSTRSCGATKETRSCSVARVHTWVQKHTNAIHTNRGIWLCFFLSDVNECWRYPGRLCAQTCENTPGSYKCSCTSGFRLSGDGKQCEGVCVLTSGCERVFASMCTCWCLWLYDFVKLCVKICLCVCVQCRFLDWADIKAGHCAAYRWRGMAMRGVSVSPYIMPCLKAQTSKNIIGLITTLCLYVGIKTLKILWSSGLWQWWALTSNLQMWMSVWPAHAVRSVPTSMVPTSATADRATTWGRMGTPVKVGRNITHHKYHFYTKRTVCSDKFMNQFHMIYFLQTSTSAPRASAICVPISVWTFLAVTSVLVLNMDTACLQMDALAEVNTPSVKQNQQNGTLSLYCSCSITSEPHRSEIDF